MVRFHDDSEYLPPSSASLTREVRCERREDPVVITIPTSPVQPKEPLEARPSPAIILPPQPESSLADSSDTTLCELEETVISSSQGLNDPSGHSTPAKTPLFPPAISNSLPVPRERRAVRDDSPYRCKAATDGPSEGNSFR